MNQNNSNLVKVDHIEKISPEIFKNPDRSKQVATVNWLGTGLEIPNLDIKVKKAIDFSQTVIKYWLSGNPEIKRRIQKLVFPKGLVPDTQKRQYLTSKFNAHFSEKQAFIRLLEEAKKNPHQK